MQRKKILVVEDRMDASYTLTAFFRRRGYEVTSTASGKEALDLIAAIQPDLVFLDGMLNEISGLDVLKELRRTDQKTLVIMLTGQILTEENIALLKELGAADVFQKPVPLARMEQTAVRLLGGTFTPAVQESPGKDDRMTRREHYHLICNLLMAVRAGCEIYVTDDEDGLHDQLESKDRNGMAVRIMKDAMRHIDEITGHLESMR